MKKHEKLLRRIHNPLLLTEGVNFYVPKDSFWFNHNSYEEAEAIAKFKGGYEKALTQAKTEDICFGLVYDFVDTDQGYGGFYSAGFVPYAQEWGSFSAGLTEKDFEHYWKKDRDEKDKYMRYLGGVNLGLWANVFHHLTVKKISEWTKASELFFEQRDNTRTCNSWMNFWATSEEEHYAFEPDCNVKITNVMFDLEKNEADREMFKEWQEEKAISSSIKTPNKFFSAPKLRFFYDGLELLSDDEEDEGIFEYPSEDLLVFGPPKSQQFPKRFISPDSYRGARGLIPAVSFDDHESDITYQFYADFLQASTDIFQTKHYCKLESSCT